MTTDPTAPEPTPTLDAARRLAIALGTAPPTADEPTDRVPDAEG